MGRKVFFDDDQQTPDTMNVTFDYGDKALIWEQRIWPPYPQDGINNGVAVYGTDGMVHIGPRRGKWEFKAFDEMATHGQDFIDSIKSRKLPNADIGIGHLSAMHCHLANIVAKTNRTLKFDAETETIVDDPGANLHVKRRYRTHWGTPKQSQC